MNWYPTIKKYFDLKCYDTDDVKVFVKVNWITSDDYKKITGIEYVA